MMTLETLILLLAGGVLSVLQELWDAFGPWLGEQSPTIKRLVTFGTYLVGGLLVFAIACAGFLGVVAPGVVVLCDETGARAILEAIVLLAIGGQTTHLLAKKA